MREYRCLIYGCQVGLAMLALSARANPPLYDSLRVSGLALLKAGHAVEADFGGEWTTVNKKFLPASVAIYLKPSGVIDIAHPRVRKSAQEALKALGPATKQAREDPKLVAERGRPRVRGEENLRPPGRRAGLFRRPPPFASQGLCPPRAGLGQPGRAGQGPHCHAQGPGNPGPGLRDRGGRGRLGRSQGQWPSPGLGPPALPAAQAPAGRQGHPLPGAHRQSCPFGGRRAHGSHVSRGPLDALCAGPEELGKRGGGAARPRASGCCITTPSPSGGPSPSWRRSWNRARCRASCFKRTPWRR
jgi:hypothetical protein